MILPALSELQGWLYRQFDHDPTPTAEFLRALAASYDLPSDLHILDVGCGVGRLLPTFSDFGWTVTGLEPDRTFCAQAQAATAHIDRVSVHCGGFTDIDEQERYNLVTMVNDPLSYLLTIEERLDALGRIYRALRPGGVMFVEIKNFLFKLLHHEPISEDVQGDSGERVVHIQQHEVDFHNATWIHRDQYIVEGVAETVRKTHAVAIITPPELMYCLKQTGFTDARTYPDYDAREPARLSDRLILMAARKPS